jgi:hypothetical protein
MPTSLANGHSVTNSLELHLTVEDRETLAELLKHEDESDRERFALAALRIGVLAVRQASGVVDAQSVQQECQKFLDQVQEALGQHSTNVSTGLGTLLSKFFDPASGEFQRRIDRLIRKDGELEMLLSQHLNGEGSALSRTLERHIGEQSPLLQMLSPDQKKGLLAALTASIQDVVQKHSESIIRQFSLDDKESALSRLVSELGEKNGDLRKALNGDLESVRKEFSLDNKDGALCRLVGQVEHANKTILLEFSADNEQSALRKLSRLLESTNSSIDTRLSLDDEKSPLSRLRGELLKVIQDLSEANNRFQSDVRTTLESLQVRKAEAARSTTHGIDFEAAVGRFVLDDAHSQEDVCDSTGTSAGDISNCKIGDFVITLCENSAAPGERIVVEAKDVKGYTFKKAREEIKTARENRDAAMGIFVWSRGNAPADQRPLCRQGQDIYVIWDQEDVATDVYLKAALSIARSLVVQRNRTMNEQTVCFHAMEEAVNTITSDIDALDDILKAANLARQHSDKIIKVVEPLREKVLSQLDTLRTHVLALQKTGPATVS